MKKLLSLLVCLTGAFVMSAQNIIYVEPGGMGSGEDPSSATDLATALTMAPGNGMPDVIQLQGFTFTNTPYVLNLAGSDGMEITIEEGVLDGNFMTRVLEIQGAPSSNGVVVTLQNLTIQKGTIDGNGAGLLVDGGAMANVHTVLNSVDFNNNICPSTGNGGGMYSNCSFEMYACNFVSNEAYNGGAIFTTYIPEYGEDLPRNIDESTFTGNYNYGNQGSTIWANCHELVINDSEFQGDPGSSSGPGSCIYGATDAGLYIDRCTFSYIEIQYWGSAIQAFDGDISVSNSLFYDNRAGTLSGYGTIAYYHNLGVTDRTINVINCTFVDNTTAAVLYSGIHYRGNGNDQLNVYNSVFWGISGSPLYAESGSASIGNCVSNSAPISFTEDTPTITDDPMLDGNFFFGEGSNLMDAGNNDWVEENWTDRWGYKRVLGDAVDIGCYELNLSPQGIDIADEYLDENAPFSTLLEDAGQVGDDNTFEFLEGPSGEGEHNDLFTISNDDPPTLSLIDPINYEELGELSLYLKITDSQEGEAQEEVILYVNDVNESPVFVGSFNDQSGTETVLVDFFITDDAFEDPDNGEVLTYSATLDDDSPLPSWLTFDADELFFEGTPTENGTWTIKVTAEDQGGLTAFGTFELEISPFISVGELTELPVQVYPNPTQGMLIIRGDLGNLTPYRVTDLSGRMLLEGYLNGTNQTLDISGFATGNYVLNLLHDGRTYGLHICKH